MTRLRRNQAWGLAFAAPMLFFFAVFSVYPFFKGISLAVFEADVFHTKFIGLENYRGIFSNEYVIMGMKNTLAYTLVTVPICTFVPFVAAALAAQASRQFQYYIRFAFYIPNLSAGIIIASVWKWIYHPSYGVLNTLFGLKVAWLGSNPAAFWSTEAILIMSSLGAPIILYLAKLLALPAEYYEAAKIDGCGNLRASWYVTLPLLTPIIAYTAIVGTIGFMQTWMVPYVMTGGGPNYGTTTLVLMIYQQAMQYGRWGYAAALGSILMAAIFVLAIIQRRYLKKRW